MIHFVESCSIIFHTHAHSRIRLLLKNIIYYLLDAEKTDCEIVFIDLNMTNRMQVNL